MAPRSQRSPRRRTDGAPVAIWLWAWFVLGALALVACGGGGSDSSDQAASVSSTTTTTAAASSSDAVGSTTTTTRPEREYPAGGPVDEIFPPGDPSYEALDGAGCAELLKHSQQWAGEGVADQEGEATIALYQSAALICLGRWSDADQVFRQIDLTGLEFPRNPCQRQAVLAWVQPLLEEWRADHAFSPVFVASSAPSPCPDATAETDASSSDSTDTTADGGG